MSQAKSNSSFYAALRIANVRLFIGSVGFFTLAARALTVVIGFQIYQLTRSPLALGWLGLVEAVPVISVLLFGGHIADHFNRHKILMLTGAASFLCAAALAFLSIESKTVPLFFFYVIIFLAGIARGFADPASTAFEAQIIPKHLTVNAGSWIGSTWISCAVVGPGLIGFVFAAWGAAVSYALIGFFFALSWLSISQVRPQEQIRPETKEPILKSISEGWRYVFDHQPLWAALMLDLFAVLFGGAIALLPIYAEDILKVGAGGLGLLNAAVAMGALLINLISTRRPPIARAGRNLIASVAAFGVCMIVFAFSKNFYLSLTALFFGGFFDGISMVIRRSMIRLLSPDSMRGRIAAANWVFVSASNELGAFESGMLAALIGTVPCVAVGGIVTLGITAAVFFLAPGLRRLRFNPRTLEALQQ